MVFLDMKRFENEEERILLFSPAFEVFARFRKPETSSKNRAAFRSIIRSGSSKSASF
jgi:hypothetical protein